MKKTISIGVVTLYSVFSLAQQKDSLYFSKDSDISEIIIYETRLDLAASLKNRNLQILDKEQIKQLPVRSVNELLTYVSGVDLRQRGPFGSQADVSIDGGSFEQNLILLNGQKISDAQTGHNSLMIPVPMEAIERIEVVRGPSARLYGVNSLTGVINIVTSNPKKDGVFTKVYGGTNFEKDIEEDRAGAEGTGELFHGRGIEVGGTLAKEQHNHMFFGTHESGNGHRYNTAFYNNKMFYQGNINPNERNTVMVLGGWSRNSFGANGFYAYPGDRESKEIVNTYLGSLSSEHLVSDRFTLAPSVMYRYNYDDYRYYRNRLDVARSQHYSHALTSNLKGSYEAGFGTLSGGAEMRYEEINSSNIGSHSRTNYGMYAELRSALFNRLDYNIGAYINYNTTYGWQVFPGVDLSYAVDNQWKMVFSAGSSQRIPSFTDLYLDQKPGNIGNPVVEPEQSYQIELGSKYQTERFQADAFVFYRDIADFIDWVRVSEDQPWQPHNSILNATIGLNASARYSIKKGNDMWIFGTSYTYLSPKVESESKFLFSKYAVESLRHQWVSTVNYRHQGFSALVAARYNERLSYKSYWIADVRVAYNFKKYQVFADAQNVLNTSYVEAGAVPMPGRWLTVGIQFNGL